MLRSRLPAVSILLVLVGLASPASADGLDVTGYTRSVVLSVAGYTGTSTLSGFPVPATDILREVGMTLGV